MDDVVHHRRGGIDDAQSGGGLGKCQFEEPLVEFRDDALLASGIGDALGADTDIAVEVFEVGGLLFQPTVS